MGRWRTSPAPCGWSCRGSAARWSGWCGGCPRRCSPPAPWSHWSPSGSRPWFRRRLACASPPLPANPWAPACLPRPWLPIWPPAPAAWPSWPIPQAAVSATRSSAAAAAGPAIRSPPPSPTPAPTPPWPPSPSARPASGSSTTPRIAASTPRRSAARPAGPSCGCWRRMARRWRAIRWRRRPPCCGAAASWPCRGWAASSCSWMPPMLRRWPGCASASAAPTSPSPCWWPIRPSCWTRCGSRLRSAASWRARRRPSCCCAAVPLLTPLPLSLPRWTPLLLPIRLP